MGDAGAGEAGDVILAEVAVPRKLFVAILGRIQRLRAVPVMAPS